MDIDPQEIVERAREASKSRLNSWVAVTVAVLATFMGICKVKDDNIVQAMQQAQADKLDHWAYYQARNIRQEVAEATVVQLELARPSAARASLAGYDTAIARYRTLAADQAKKKDDLRAQAEQDQRTYDALNYRDDQFDLSDALLAIAIAMLAVTALTGRWALFWVAMVPTALGIVFGLAGLASLPLHPNVLVRLLS
jgi:uncharacterized protein DUF4337